MAKSTVNISVGKSHRLVDEPGVEVDVRVELARDEVVIGQGDLFELQRDVEQRVLAGHRKDLVGQILHDGGARVEVLVDAMSETVEQRLLLRLDFFDEGGHVLHAADLA